MFGADGIVQQPIGFFGRMPQYALAGRAERDLLGLRHSVAPREATDDVFANAIEGGAGWREDPAAKALVLIQQPEEDVRRFDGAGSELTDLGASVEEDLKRS